MPFKFGLSKQVNIFLIIFLHGDVTSLKQIL